MEHSAHGMADIRPAVPMRDDDRNAAQPPEERAPEIGAEHVGVQDVDPLTAQDPDQAPEGEQVEAPRARDVDVNDPRAPQCGREGVVRRRGGRADVYLIAFGRQMHRDRTRKALRTPATTDERVDEHQDPHARFLGPDRTVRFPRRAPHHKFSLLGLIVHAYVIPVGIAA